MTHPTPATVDFETAGIKGRPDYPPKPCGVSIKLWGQKAHYYAWGHPTKNNCTQAQAVKALKAVWRGDMLFQNAKFDLDVAETHLGLPMPKWDRVHDTMFLLFLDDPHAQTLSLKPSAHRLLGMKPDEQTAVKSWLIKNQPLMRGYTLKKEGIKISESQGSEHYWAAYICLAPGDLVGRYADGDVIRTEKLFKLLYKKTVDRGMLGAYDRERQLMPILLEMERQGIQLDLKRLKADVAMYSEWRIEIDAWIIKLLKCSPDINLNSGTQLVDAMLKVGKVDKGALGVTEKGRVKTDKEALLNAVSDKQLLAVLKYRTQLKTCMDTFMIPWLGTALKSDGRIFTNYNQVKSTPGADNTGARTGRLSSNPNFQNIPQVFKPIFHHEDTKAKLPKSPFKGLPTLPKVRSYITPFKGHILVDRDYSQQEPRILAHFEGGALMEQYQENPWIDFHDNAKQTLESVLGKVFDRKKVKTINLGLIYGMGLGLLAQKNDSTIEETKEIKSAILSMYPGLKQMFQDMRIRAAANKPIRTWGGREYYCEPAKIVQGRMMTFDYKMVNVLIQGSAADCTKEAIIRFDKVRKPGWYLILNVHDQLTVSCPIKEMKACMETLRKAMESVEFDVEILSEGSTSKTNWAELKDYDKKGKVLK